MKPILSHKAIVAIAQWFADDDTGTSSQTIAVIAMGAKKVGKARMDAPHDPDDFGRCLRLVKRVPELREHFARIGKTVKAFAGILDNWDELVAIYERDRPTGRSQDLYRRIKELRGDCQDHPVLKTACQP